MCVCADNVCTWMMVCVHADNEWHVCIYEDNGLFVCEDHACVCVQIMACVCEDNGVCADHGVCEHMNNGAV